MKGGVLEALQRFKRQCAGQWEDLVSQQQHFGGCKVGEDVVRDCHPRRRPAYANEDARKLLGGVRGETQGVRRVCVAVAILADGLTLVFSDDMTERMPLCPLAKGRVY